MGKYEGNAVAAGLDFQDKILNHRFFKDCDGNIDAIIKKLDELAGPKWADAPAVMAHVPGYEDEDKIVLVRGGTKNIPRWHCALSGDIYGTDELIVPVPLVEEE